MILWSLVALPSILPVDPRLAEQYFAEAVTASNLDAGKLWGKPLGGPMIFVDPATRAAVTNRPPPDPKFQKVGTVFVGTLPADMMVANTAVPWGNQRWAMIMGPLPEDKADRISLMMHESWHRIQADLKLPGDIVSNGHLDSQIGRTWIQLELRALALAHKSTGAKRRRALEDALNFRAFRQRSFPGSKATEDRMEMHEGLAEYTGVRLSRARTSERSRVVALQRSRFEALDSFAASFAYYTGPAYGLVLDEVTPGWQRRVTVNSSLSATLSKSLKGFKPTSDPRAAAARYGYLALYDAETKREQKRLAQERNYLQAFVEGPVITIALVSMNFRYNPGTLFPLLDRGTVYPETTISDQWGKLAATEGALISPDFSRVTVSAKGIGPDTRKANGWSLELNLGWSLIPGKRPGDFVVSKTGIW